MKVNEKILAAANAALSESETLMSEEQFNISTIGCFGCGMGCSGTVGG